MRCQRRKGVTPLLLYTRTSGEKVKVREREREKKSKSQRISKRVSKRKRRLYIGHLCQKVMGKRIMAMERKRTLCKNLVFSQCLTFSLMQGMKLNSLVFYFIFICEIISESHGNSLILLGGRQVYFFWQGERCLK